jgi:cytidylate kinase
MRSNIITISREFGSGGRLVGRQLAEKLGYKYYDKNLLDEISV